MNKNPNDPADAAQATTYDPSQGDICPKGYYCPAGTIAAIKYKPGYYCDTTGIATPTKQCDAGYYRIEGRPRCDQPTGLLEISARRGTRHRPPCPMLARLVPIGNRRLCPCQVRQYCADLGATAPSGNCSEGYYCDALDPPPISPRRRYAMRVISVQKVVRRRRAGSYYSHIGLKECLECPAGFYCDLGAVDPVKCGWVIGVLQELIQLVR